jgi:hypothetical protein
LGHSNARTTERYLIDNDVYDGDVGDFVTWWKYLLDGR